jgi:4-hydroxy-tetrahydrodipicolinate reductase
LVEGTTVLQIGLGGALGRMGHAVAEVLAARADAKVATVYDRPGVVGETVIGLTLTDASAALPFCDVAIDFSTPAATAAVARLAAGAGRPALVIGATGWTEAEEAVVAEAARRVAIVKSGNYSLGVNVLAGLVEQAARRLAAADWDVEISETHHHRKVDAPSGTALMLGEAAAEGRGVGLGQVQVKARDGITGPRPPGAIGFSSLRAGGIVGDHSVMFASEEEVLTLSHSARDRKLFARGAVAAALWVANKPPGLYDMKDVLGFRGA